MAYVTIEEPLTRLGLSPIQMIVLGLIAGYSQNDQGLFYGTRAYIQQWTGCRSHVTIDKTLRELCEKGLLQKGEIFENGQRRVFYKATIPTDLPGSNNDLTPGQKMTSPGSKNDPNNKSIINDDNLLKERNKEKQPLPFDSEAFRETWNDLLKQPAWRTKTLLAIQRNLKFLAQHTESEAIQIMDNTIRGGWKGLFELDARTQRRNPGPRTNSRGETPMVASMRASHESLQRIAERRTRETRQQIEGELEP